MKGKQCRGFVLVYGKISCKKHYRKQGETASFELATDHSTLKKRRSCRSAGKHLKVLVMRAGSIKQRQALKKEFI